MKQAAQSNRAANASGPSAAVSNPCGIRRGVVPPGSRARLAKAFQVFLVSVCTEPTNSSNFTPGLHVDSSNRDGFEPQGLNRRCRVPSPGTLPRSGKGSVRGPCEVLCSVSWRLAPKLEKNLVFWGGTPFQDVAPTTKILKPKPYTKA